MATVAKREHKSLLTVEEYLQLPPAGRRTELVRGKVVFMNPPFPWHGFVCGKVVLFVGGFIETNDLGYPLCNDSGVVTEQDPDTLRGADFAFYSYQQVPKGTLQKKGYLYVTPKLIVEVKSPDDLWKDVLAKVAEYSECWRDGRVRAGYRASDRYHLPRGSAGTEAHCRRNPVFSRRATWLLPAGATVF
jgi:Uma2 family endonuclease